MLRRHELPPTLRLPAIRAYKKIPHRALILHHALHLAILAPKLQLVPELPHPIIDQILRADILLHHFKVRRAHAKHMRHERRLPLRNAIHRRAAPVMAPEHDGLRAEGLRDGLDGVSVRFEPEVAQVGGRARVAIAHAVERDAPEAQAREQRDLVAPSEGAVREAVDEDRGALLAGGAGGEVEVGWEAWLDLLELGDGGKE